MAGSINRVILVGNLTRDPETRTTGGGTTVCSLRVAVNDRVPNKETGGWEDYANYFTVSVFGKMGENCAQYLSKGRQVAVDGRLRWRQWETQDGQKREAIEVVADSVQFIGPRDAAAAGGGRAQGGPGVPFDSGDFPPDQTDTDDDDIPF
ncbi:MAG TPA: single-stranded DNA-binding protein [Thermoleophilia bacterium]|nr:single-stranded DNA-binding protein [Thermoleophilia bacterium]